jgi:3'(2'), 5'-bisphosphate nucleotidase
MINVISDIAIKAGEKIMEVRSKGFDVELKADESPVTQADKASNEVILKELKAAYPEIPIISEETASADYETRKNWTEFFLVDPLDGTKEFIKDNGEFCVCIAYMKNKRPALSRNIYFLIGASIIFMVRPSVRGLCSIFAIS